MTAAVSLIALAIFAFGVWWMISTWRALKAIQRHLGADPTFEQSKQWKAQYAANEAARQARKKVG